MYLSDVDLRRAIETGKLIFEPKPATIDATSIDLHLDGVDHAKVWDVDGYVRDQDQAGNGRPELRIGKYQLGPFSGRYLTSPPLFDKGSSVPVQKRGNEIIVRTGGFLLWQTKEKVGTPTEDAEFICFVNGKSTRARAGIVVHLTAPTIHSSWVGQVTLEIANLGPFDLVLQEDDVIAQLTVAKASSAPTRTMAMTSQTFQQCNVSGSRSSS
jgi:deoxycytidine triphosphate deaminase